MGKVLNASKRLVKIKTNGRIAALGNIVGPITYPCMIDNRKVINMVQQGVKVYEVNPENHAEEVLLTIQNVNKNNFAKKTESAASIKKQVENIMKANEVVVPKVEVSVTTATPSTIQAETTVAATEEADGAENSETAGTDEVAETATSTDNNSYNSYKNNKKYKSDFKKK